MLKPNRFVASLETHARRRAGIQAGLDPLETVPVYPARCQYPV